MVISTITANAAPTIADRIGTASISLPGWRANRRPIAAGAGRSNIASLRSRAELLAANR